jgi:hypothetical protein
MEHLLCQNNVVATVSIRDERTLTRTNKFFKHTPKSLRNYLGNHFVRDAAY